MKSCYLKYSDKTCLWQAIDCATNKVICSSHIWEICCKLAAGHGYEAEGEAGIRG